MQQRQIDAVGIEAALERQLHVGHQRCAISQFASALQENRQGHARRQRRPIAQYLLASIEQQTLQTPGQACHVQGFGQIGRRRQRQGLAHAGTVVTAAHQNEWQWRITFALANTAQHIQAIDAGQLPVNDHQVVGIFREQAQCFLTIGTQIQPYVAAHAQQYLLEQVTGPGVGLGNQHTRYSR
ncbi:hypothetical protein D3C87_1598740 [compost metagenome]